MDRTSDYRKRLSGAGAPKPRAMPLKEALRYSGLSRSTFYRFAGEGRIELLKVGRSTLAVTESLDALLDSLPRALLARHGAELSSWEIQFLRSIASGRGAPTAKQLAVLKRIATRVQGVAGA